MCWLTLSCENTAHIATIDHKFYGCFAMGHNKLKVYKEANFVVARWERDGEEPLKVRLNRSQMDSLNNFILELKNLEEENSCTSVDYYHVINGNETIRKTDGGCSWDGFGRLITTLFWKKK